MSRYRLIQSVYGAPPGMQQQRFRAGTTVADSVANAVAGDVTWPALCAIPNPVVMQPLDQAAQAVLASQNLTVAPLGVAVAVSTGMDSVA